VSPKKAHSKDNKETIQKITPTKSENRPEDVEEKTFSTELCKFVGDFINYMISERGNKAPKKSEELTNSSLDAIEKLIRLDGFSFEYIKAVSRWAVVDKFYAKNFFSLAPLRKKSKTNDVTKFVNMAARYDLENGAVKDGPPKTEEEILKSWGISN